LLSNPRQSGRGHVEARLLVCSSARLLVVAVVALALPVEARASCTANTWSVGTCDQSNCVYTWTQKRRWTTFQCKDGSSSDYLDPTCISGCGDTSIGSELSCAPQDPEISNSGIDNNCDGRIGERTGKKSPGPPDQCEAGAGKDPIMLGSRSVITDPQVDFSTTTVGPIEFSRSYSSADTAYFSGPVAVFGPGWHHNWEMKLACATTCVLINPNEEGEQFNDSGQTAADGSAIWLPSVSQLFHDVLLRGATTSRVFESNGRELDFSTSTGALTAVVDTAGNVTTVEQNPTGSIILRVTDPVGHVLALNGSSGVPASLSWDGTSVATYTFSGGNLTGSIDGNGAPMRSYGYLGTGGRLTYIQDENAQAIVEFSYDSNGWAIGTSDAASTVTINYQPMGYGHRYVDVIESYGNGATNQSTRYLDSHGTVEQVSGTGCSCGPNKTKRFNGALPDCVAEVRGDGGTRVSYTPLDSLGRVTRRVAYNTDPLSACGVLTTPPATMPADSTDESITYGITRTVGGSVTLILDTVTQRTHKGALTGGTVTDAFDYSQAHWANDPSGYTCTPSALPAGSVLCRNIVTGQTKNAAGATITERHATFFSYDTRGRLVKKIGPVNLDNPSPYDVTPTEERTYWADNAGSYRAGRLHEVKAYATPTSAAMTTTMDYSLLGTSSITSPTGGVTTIARDGRGRPTSVTPPAQSATTFFYRNATRAADLQVLPSGATLRTSYDGRGRVYSKERFDSNPEVYPAAIRGWAELVTYDGAGNENHLERQATSSTVLYKDDREYDFQHRMVRRYHPSYTLDRSPTSTTPKTSYSYDGLGFLRTVVDEIGRETDYTPDGLGRITSVLRTDGVHSTTVAAYAYAPGVANALTGVTDGNSHQTTYLVDDFDRVVSITSADTGTTTFVFDPRGNLFHKEDARTTVDYHYDGRDRITSQVAAAKPVTWSVTYGYTYDGTTNGKGKLTSATEAHSYGSNVNDRSWTFVYDAAGRLTSEVRAETSGPTLTTGYLYDADGATSRVDYPSGLQVLSTRSLATGEVISVGSPAATTRFASNVVHLPLGPVSSLTYGNGRTFSASFNLRYEPSGAWTSGPLSLTYSMNDAGDVSQLDDVATRKVFAFDHIDRLTSATTQTLPNGSPGPWLSYTLDNAGNRTAETVEGTSTTYALVSGTDQLASQTTGSSTRSYYSDGSGNVVAMRSGANDACLTHDPLGRLGRIGKHANFSNPVTSCQSPTQSLTSPTAYSYDLQSRRAARTVGSTTTLYAFDSAGRIISEGTKSGTSVTWLRDYIWLDGRPLMQAEKATGKDYAVHLDHIGLPRAVTNSLGTTTVWTATYRPFGDIGETTVTDPVTGKVVATALRLPGQYDDKGLEGLGFGKVYNTWRRWYAPQLERFVEPDPTGIHGVELNPFVYAIANALRWIDPSGLIALRLCSLNLSIDSSIEKKGQTEFDLSFVPDCNQGNLKINISVPCSTKLQGGPGNPLFGQGKRPTTYDEVLLHEQEHIRDMNGFISQWAARHAGDEGPYCNDENCLKKAEQLWQDLSNGWDEAVRRTQEAIQ
jgi:RHS repeat-associated protein